jgi:hypothetical protein
VLGRDVGIVHRPGEHECPDQGGDGREHLLLALCFSPIRPLSRPTMPRTPAVKRSRAPLLWRGISQHKAAKGQFDKVAYRLDEAITRGQTSLYPITSPTLIGHLHDRSNATL